MGFQNKGNQQELYKFRTPLDSDYINKLFQDVFSCGVYNGFEVSKIDNVTVNINPGKAIISDGIYTSIIETLESIDNQIVSPLIPYIVMRWSYSANVSWYADFTAVSYSGIRQNDIILAKVIFDNSSNIISVNNDIKILPDSLRLEQINNNLRVNMNYSTPGMSVIVNPGFIYGLDGVKHTFISTTVNISTADSTNPRIDLVVVDGNSQINILTGTPSSTPVAPNAKGMFVLSEVYVGANVTIIYDENLNDDRSFFTPIFQLGQIILGLTEKTSITGNDLFVIADSENLYNQKKIKYSTIRNQTNPDAKTYLQSDTTESTDVNHGALVMQGGIAVQKNINGGENLNLAGNAVIGENLTVDENLQVNGNAVIDGNLQANGTLLIEGNTTVNGTVTIYDTLYSGDADFGGEVTIEEQITFPDNSYFTSAMGGTVVKESGGTLPSFSVPKNGTYIVMAKGMIESYPSQTIFSLVVNSITLDSMNVGNASGARLSVSFIGSIQLARNTSYSWSLPIDPTAGGSSAYVSNTRAMCLIWISN